jgi:putative DNA primase/helicase
MISNAFAGLGPAGRITNGGGVDDDAEIRRLAALKPLAYEREREAVAEKMGCRVSMLDKVVARERGDNAALNGQGSPLELPEIEPWPARVDGAELLTGLAQAMRRYVVMGAHEADAAALWAVGTHRFSVFAIFPRLFITAAEKQSGKTTLLDVLSNVVSRPLLASNITAAALFRTIAVAKPALLLDEADSYAKENEELRGIINSGHRADGAVIRTVGEQFEPRSFGVFSPMAIAAIGDLAATILDRSVILKLVRRRPDEAVEPMRLDRAPADLKMLARKAARWAADHGKALAAADPAIPASIANRAADNWRPLIAIADVAGGLWAGPEGRGRGCAVSLTLAVSDASTRVQLLEDIHTAFAAKGVDRLTSADLVAHLVAREDRPWPEYGRARKPLTATQMARLLSPLAISPGSLRPADGATATAKGYYRRAFEDAFARYLAPIAGKPPF